MSKEMYDEYDSASTCIKTFHKIGNTAKNYNDAKAACEARGESLPIIRTEEDNQNVRNACGASTYCCWIGLEQQTDKSWKWVDGSSLDYSKWDGTEGTSGHENRAFVCPGRGFGGWHDVNNDGDGKTEVVCQKHKEDAVEFVATKRTWQAARSDCQSRGKDLVVITNAAQNNAVLTFLQGQPESDFTGSNGWGGAWIHATDAQVEGQWGSYTNWNPGEPNGGTSECCCTLATGAGNAQW